MAMKGLNSMKKRFAAIPVFLVAALCVLTACTRLDGLAVQDSSGKNRVIVTNESGEPVYDDAGNVLIIKTDEKGRSEKDSDGNLVTNPLSMDYVIDSGEMLYCRYFSMAKPDGYEVTSYGYNISLVKKDGSSITFSYDDSAKLADKLSAQADIVTAMKEQKGAEVETETYEKEIAGAKASFTEIRVSGTVDGEDKSALIISCIFERDGVVYSVDLQTDDLQADAAELESIIGSVSFR